MKHLHLKPATKFLKHAEGSVGILFHKDGDGVCSAAQIIAYLKTKNIKPELFCGEYEESDVKPFVETELEHYIILDMSSDEILKWILPLEGKNVLIIDHHISKSLEKMGFVHLNPRFEDPNIYISTSEIVGQVLKRMGFKGKEWVARLGGVCDRSLEGNEEEIKASEIIDSVKAIQKERGMLKLAKFLADAKKLDDLIFEEKFQKSHKELWNEVERQIIKYELQAHGNVTFFEIRGNFSITSILVNKLFELYPNRTIIVYRETAHGYKISGRSNKYDLNNAFSKASEGIGVGGGHSHAAGAKVSDFTKFRKRLLKIFREEERSF